MPLTIVLGAAIAFALVLAACTKTPLVAPSGTVMTLIAETNELAVNGSTDIRAVLIRSGSTTGGTATTSVAGAGTAVHDGTLVTFTTSLGKIEPAQARTTAGFTTVTLTATGISGVATVTAFSGGTSKTLTVNIGTAAAARILVSASPQALPATGGTTTITANVQDQQGNGIQGAQVNFSTTAGSISTGTVVTDSSGNASTTLTTTAAATVTASAGGGTGTAATFTGTVMITVLPNATVSINPPSGPVTVSTPTTLTVSVGTTVIVTNVVVDFGDGESVSLGPISQTQNVPHLYGFAGGLTAKATATFADGTTKTVQTPVIVTDFSVTLTSTGNVTFGGASTFTANVTPTGVSIASYTWDFGDEGVVSTSGNQISHVFQSRGTKVVTVTVVPTKGSSKRSVTSLEVS